MSQGVIYLIEVFLVILAFAGFSSVRFYVVSRYGKKYRATIMGERMRTPWPRPSWCAWVQFQTESGVKEVFLDGTTQKIGAEIDILYCEFFYRTVLIASDRAPTKREMALTFLQVAAFFLSIIFGLYLFYCALN